MMAFRAVAYRGGAAGARRVGTAGRPGVGLAIPSARAQGKFSEGGAQKNWQVACRAAAAAGAAGVILYHPGRDTVLAESASGGAPPFTMDKPKFDQSTFYGRLMAMLDVIDPNPLFLSRADLQKSQDIIEAFKKDLTKPAGLSDADMWAHRKNVEVSIHPVTGEVLFPLGRMSAFIPMNVPLCALMLMASTPSQVVFTQWLNQTYNVMNNYVNRSGATVDWSALLGSYALAVTASCSIAMGAKKLIAAVPALEAAGPFVPYLAVISAGSANVSFTRFEEWNGKGVSVVDTEGKDLGLSRKAGQQSVLQTVVSRSCFLPIAPMVLPVLAMKALPAALKVGVLGVASELVLITACLGGMLPVALALLPQTMEIDVTSLEPEFHNLKDSKGQPVTKVFANKGL
jgi:tricarboxylate carrier